MIAWGFSEADVLRAADVSEVKINNFRRDGKGLRFTLKLAPSKRWQKVSIDRWRGEPETRRRTAAVCWHGHYRFMRELFRANEHGRIKSAVADYRSLDDFLAKAPVTGMANVGSLAYPIQACETCDCEATGDFILESN